MQTLTSNVMFKLLLTRSIFVCADSSDFDKITSHQLIRHGRILALLHRDYESASIFLLDGSLWYGYFSNESFQTTFYEL